MKFIGLISVVVLMSVQTFAKGSSTPSGQTITGPTIYSSYIVRTGDAKFYGNLAKMSLMNNVLTVSNNCRLSTVNGQFKASEPTVSQKTIKLVRTEWVARSTYTCTAGSYIGFLASHQLGASEISFAATKSIGATVCLSQNAVSNVTVALESYSTTVARVPASVIISAGSRCANYSISIVGALDTYIHAKLNGYWISNFLRVNP
jgi:hypothetical protein